MGWNLWHRNGVAWPDQASCPDDAQLAAFIDGALEKPHHDALESHLHDCASCVAAIAHVAAVGDTQPGEPRSGALLGEDTGPGHTIDRFIVLDVLGVGGMGVVYSAYDPQLYRKIAIKVLHAGSAEPRSDAGRLRLLREAQAMARIDHPNVIHVHDVGSHGDQIHVAMELADAGTLRAWLTGAHRAVREIVAVFVQAGRGLAAAHAAGLIHRDFKADNVLLFKGGRVCVTDFGLVGLERAAGSATDLSSPGLTAGPVSLSGSEPLAQDLTRTGAIMGTPQYMAPEQFLGQPVTASSDQFSFCVALYEAIHGVHPFGGTTLQELATTVTRGKLAVTPRGRRVPRWLDRVLVRGLATAPAHRFPSMTALVDELARDHAGRRVRLAGGALATAGIAAIGAAFVLRPAHAVTCGRAEDHLVTVWSPTRRHQLEAAFLGSGRPHAAATLARLTPVVDAWQHSWATGHREACEATRVRGEQSEQALDLRMQCLSDRLDDAAAVLALLAAGGGDAIDHALDAVMRLPSVEPCGHASALAAATHGPRAGDAGATAVRERLAQARAMVRLGRYAGARDLAEPAVDAARATADPSLVADALLALGDAQLLLADQRAVGSLREATHVAKAAGDTTTELAASAGLVTALTALRSKYEVALEVSELADATAANVRPATELVVKLGNARGDLDLARGKPAEARARYQQTLASAEQALGRDHLAVLTTLGRLGNALKEQGKFADARKLYERVLASRERLEAPDHPDVATALSDLGNVSRAEGKLVDARRLYERALAIRIAALGPEHPAVADSYNNLGTFHAEQQDLVTARRYFDQAIAMYEKIYGASSTELAHAVTNLGNALVVLGQLDAARATLGRARQLYEASLAPDDPHLGYVMSELGVIDEREGKLDAALTMIRGAEQIAIKALGPDHPEIADYLERESSVLASQDKLADAEAIAVRAAQLYERSYGGEHPRVAMALGAIAGLQGRRGDYRAALASWQRSLAIFEAALASNHPNLSFALAGIGDAMTELGRGQDALPYLERALQLRSKARMPPGLVAEIHFYLAAALVQAPATRARGITEAGTALAMYQQAGDAENTRELKTWLASHR